MNKIKKDISTILLKFKLNITIKNIYIFKDELYFEFFYEKNIYKIVFNLNSTNDYVKKTKYGFLIYYGEIGEFKYANKLMEIIWLSNFHT